MKLRILSIVAAAGLVTSALGQGIILDNLANNGGQAALSGGRVYIDNGTTVSLFDGLTFNLGVTVLGGPDAGSLSPMGSFTAGTDIKGYTGADVGKFQLGAAFASVNVPGVVAGGTATIQLQIWYDGAGGLFADYAAAAVLGAGGYVGTVTFQNGVSNPNAGPPVPPPGLSGMPSIILVQTIPEPGTLALAGLGAASLLIFRRRK